MKSLVQKYLFIVILIHPGFIIISCKQDKKVDEPPCVECSDFDHFAIDYDPAWSHDGKFITYYHEDKELAKAGLYIISPDGTGNKLWHQGVSVNSPSWSPDGGWITFSHGVQIWKKKIDGDSLQQLTTVGRNFYPSWSPDGKWIAYDSDVDSPTGLKFIWKMHHDGSNKTRIAYDTVNGETRMPYWAKNDVISHVRYVNSGSHHPEVFIMDSNGDHVRRLTNDSHHDRYPRLSSNNQIVFSRQSSGESPKIWIMSAVDGDSKTNLGPTTEVCEWSPDGNRIVYTNAIKSDGRLWIMHADGSNKKQLTFINQF